MAKFCLINLEIINKGDIMAERIIHQADLRAIENNLRSIHEGLRTIGFHTSVLSQLYPFDIPFEAHEVLVSPDCKYSIEICFCKHNNPF